MKLLNTLTATFAVLFFATNVWAGISVSHDITAEYSVDNEKSTLIYAPEIAWSSGDLSASAGSSISMYDSSAADSITLFNIMDDGSRPDISMELSYDLSGKVNMPIEMNIKTGWDIDASERKDVTIGATLSF